MSKSLPRWRKRLQVVGVAAAAIVSLGFIWREAKMSAADKVAFFSGWLGLPEWAHPYVVLIPYIFAAGAVVWAVRMTMREKLEASRAETDKERERADGLKRDYDLIQHHLSSRPMSLDPFVIRCQRIIDGFIAIDMTDLQHDEKYDAAERAMQSQQWVAVLAFREAQHRGVLPANVPLDGDESDVLAIWKEVSHFADSEWKGEAPPLKTLGQLGIDEKDGREKLWHTREMLRQMRTHAIDLVRAVSNRAVVPDRAAQIRGARRMLRALMNDGEALLPNPRGAAFQTAAIAWRDRVAAFLEQCFGSEWRGEFLGCIAALPGPRLETDITTANPPGMIGKPIYPWDWSGDIVRTHCKQIDLWLTNMKDADILPGWVPPTSAPVFVSASS